MIDRPTLFDHPRPLAIAHRGGALEGDENTHAAFAHARSLGYCFIETDVQATRDGVAVIHHDDTLERSCGAPDRIADLGWSELSRRRTRAGNPIPRLDDTLAAFPQMRFILEAKSDAAPGPMAEAIARTNALPRICVGAFSARRTEALRAALGPGLAWSPAHAGVARVWLAGWGLPIRPPACTALQVPERFRGIPVATARLLRAAHAHGLQIHVWTVNDRAGMTRLLDLGIDGLMTDRPTLLRDVLRSRGQWTGAD